MYRSNFYLTFSPLQRMNLIIFIPFPFMKNSFHTSFKKQPFQYFFLEFIDALRKLYNYNRNILNLKLILGKNKGLPLKRKKKHTISNSFASPCINLIKIKQQSCINVFQCLTSNKKNVTFLACFFFFIFFLVSLIHFIPTLFMSLHVAYCPNCDSKRQSETTQPTTREISKPLLITIPRMPLRSKVILRVQEIVEPKNRPVESENNS